jgi:hypothetical protein
MTQRLFLFVLFFFVVAVDAQSINLLNPWSQVYLDVVNFGISINDPNQTPQRIWLTWEYTVGVMDAVGAVYRTEFTYDEVKVQMGSFRPLDPFELEPEYNGFDELIRTYNSTSAHVSFMPNGMYTVTAFYLRPVSVGGATINSASRAGVTLGSVALPVEYMAPTNNSIVTEDFLLLVRLYELPQAGSAQFVISNGTSTQTLVLAQARYYALHQINNTIDITNSTINSTSGEPIYFFE